MLTTQSRLHQLTKFSGAIILGLLLITISLTVFSRQIAPAQAAPLAVGPTVISQSITSPTNWSPADSPYIISGTIDIQAQLTIAPGTVISFTQNSGLSIKNFPTGQLLANGTPAQPIRFTSAPGVCVWDGVSLESDQNQIQYTHFEYAQQAIKIDDSDQHTIRFNTFENNGGCPSLSGAILGETDLSLINSNVFTRNQVAIRLSRSSQNRITENVISDTIDSGIFFAPTGATPAVSNIVATNTVRYAGTYGIYMASGIGNTVQSNQVHHNTTGGIRLENQTVAQTIVRNNDVYSNTGPGLSVTQTFSLDLVDNLIWDNNAGIQWELGNSNMLGSHNLANNVICQNTQYQFQRTNPAPPVALDVTPDWWGTNNPTMGLIGSGSDIESAAVNPVNIDPRMIFTTTSVITAMPADGVSTTDITISLGAGGATVPARARTVNLSTTLGTLSANQITLDSSGVGTVTLTAAPTLGTALITTTEFCGFSVPLAIEFQAADVAIDKDSPVTQITPGDLITYTIPYTNNAAIAATNVRITDTLPAGVSFVSDNSGAQGFSRMLVGNQIIWTHPALPGNTNGVITLTTQLPTAATSSCGLTLTNSVEITTTASDSDPTNNNASHTSGIQVLCADVGVSKSSNLTQVSPGQTVTYTVTFSNSGNTTAQNVTITDTLPTNVTWLNDTAIISGFTRSQTAPSVVWNLGSLLAGTNGEITLVGQLAANAICGANLTNQADIATTTADGDASNNTATHSGITTVCADLVITKTVVTPALSIGHPTTFQIAYQNVGPFTATGVVITDFLDSNVTYLSDTSGETVLVNPGTVQWNLSNPVGSGQSGAFTLDLSLDPVATCVGGTVTFTNSATIASDRPDINSSDNSSAIPTPVIVSCDPDLVIDKVDGLNGGSVLAGGLITYTLTYSNIGGTPATNVVLTETLPANTSFVGPAGWNGGPSIYTMNVGTVPTQTTASVNFIVRVDPATTATAVTNTVTIDGAENDPAPTDNTDIEVTPITPSPDLTITKIGLSPIVRPGEPVTYLITMTNQGSLTISNVLVTDTLPTATTFSSNTVIGAPSSVSGSTVVWDVGQFTPGQTTSFSMTLVADAGNGICNDTHLLNTVETRGNTAEGDESNNISSTTTTNSPLVVCQDLAITKTLQSAAVSFGKVTTFTISYANPGITAMDNVVITDVLDSNIAYVTDTLGGATTTPGTVRWNLGTVPAGASGSFDIGVQPLTCPGLSVNFINTAQIDSTTPEPYLLNNSSQAGPVNIPCGQVDLTIVKNDRVGGLSEPTFVYAGDRITYTIAFANAGDLSASGVVITETLPTYTTFVGPVGANGWFSAGGGLYTYQPGATPGTLGPNEGGNLEFVVRVVPTLPNTVTVVHNLIEIDGNDADADNSDNNSQEQTPVRAIPDLVVQKTALTPVVRPNQNITYAITVTNQGGGSAHSVVISDTLPANTTFVGDTLVFVSMGVNPITWNVGTILPGQTISFEITLLADANICLGTSVVNTVQAGGMEPDANPADNEDTAILPLGCRDVAITKTVDTPQTGIDRDVVFTLIYSNPGVEATNSTLITDTLPAGITFVESNPVHAGPFGGAYQWNVGALAPGITGTIVITGHVNNSLALCDQTLTNTSGIAATFSGGSEQYLANNVDTAAVNIRCLPDMTIIKNDRIGGLAEPPFVQAGDVYTYSILYTNLGIGTANNVVITETLPNHTTFVGPFGSNGWHQVGATRDYTYTVGSVNAGFGNQVQFAVQVESPLTLASGSFITNTVCVGTADTEIMTGNNCSYEQTLVQVNRPRLEIIKSATPPSGSTVQPGQTMTYTISVESNGQLSAQNVRLTDTLPSEVTFVNATLSTGGPINGPNPLTADLGNLAVGSRVTMTVVSTINNVPSGTLIINNAQSSADNVNLQMSNVVTHVVRSPDPVPPTALVGNKSATPPHGSTVQPNELITYTLRVTNQHSTALNGVVITDAIPTNTTFVSSSASSGSISGPDPLVVNVGTLNASQSAILTFTVRVTNTATTGTVISNSGQFASDQTPLTNTNVVTHVVQPPVLPPNALVANKSATPPPGSSVQPSDLITYTIQATNNDTSPLTNVVITDAVPANTTFVSSSVSQGAISGPDPLVVNVGTLNASQSATFTFTVRVTSTATAGMVISNIGQFASDQTAISNTNTVTHVVVAAGPTVLLEAHKSATPPHGSSVQPNDLITYTIRATNNDTNPMTNIVITDSLPISTTFITSSTTQGAVSGPDPLVINFGTLAGGANAAFTFTVRVDTAAITGTVISNSAQIDSDQTTISPTNTVTHVVGGVLTPTVLLEAHKSATPPHGSTVAPTDLITYTIRLTNRDTISLTNVVLTDALPSNTTFVGASTSLGFLIGPNPLVLSIGTLNAGQSATLTFTVRVTDSAGTGTIISNVGQVVSERTALSNTNVVTHVIGATGPFTIYLPIILKDYPPQDPTATLSWVSQLQDRVQELDGGNPASMVPDGKNDGQFLLTVNTNGPAKIVDHVRLVSDQTANAQWDTSINGVALLGIYNGSTKLNNADGTVTGMVVDTQIIVSIFGSDDPTSSRFPPDTYTYTVYVTFTDGTVATASARIPPIPTSGLAWVSDVKVDQTTNQVFIADPNQNRVHAIDGATDTYKAGVPVGHGPTGLTVLTSTNPSKVFVAHAFALNNWTPGIWSIDSDDLEVRAMSDQGGYVGAAPVKIGSNPNPGWERVYVSNYFDRLPILHGPTETRLGWVPKKSFQASYGVDVSMRTNLVYLASIDTGELIVFDADQGENVANYGACHHAPPEARVLRMVAVNQTSGHVFVTSPPDTNKGQLTSKVYVMDENVLLTHTGGPPSDLTCTWNFLIGEIETAAIPGPAWVATIDLPGAISAGEEGLAVNEITGKVYVTDGPTDTLYVIDYDTSTNTVNGINKVTVDDNPQGVDVNPWTNKVYVGNARNSSAPYGTVSVVDGATNTVIKTIPLTP